MAPIVREAFQRYADGGTIRDVVQWLNAVGVKNTRGKTMSDNVVTRMLKNRTYIGEYHHGDHVIPGGVPVLIDVALFNRVQERFVKNKRLPMHFKAEDEYILTTKLFCGKCGNMLIGESGTGRNGTVHRYYKCTVAKRKNKCTLKAVKKQWIEDFVIGEVMQALNDDSLLNRVADLVMAYQSRDNTIIPLLRKRLSDTDKQIDNMISAIRARYCYFLYQKEAYRIGRGKREPANSSFAGRDVTNPF
jgi:hypothetical protein